MSFGRMVLVCLALAAALALGGLDLTAEAAHNDKYMTPQGWQSVPDASTTTKGLVPLCNSRTDQFLAGTGAFRSVQALSASTAGLCPVATNRTDHSLLATGSWGSEPTTHTLTVITLTPVDAAPSAPTTGAKFYVLAADGAAYLRFSSGDPVAIATHP